MLALVLVRVMTKTNGMPCAFKSWKVAAADQISDGLGCTGTMTRSASLSKERTSASRLGAVSMKAIERLYGRAASRGPVAWRRGAARRAAGFLRRAGNAIW